MSPPSSLLLIKPGSMGDVIHALPVAAAIRRAWPDIRLKWVADPRWAPLLEGNPCGTEVLRFPREEFRGPSGWLRAGAWYRSLAAAGRPDVAVDLQCLLRSALMARCSGAADIIGLGDAREGARFFYHRVAATSPGEHSVSRYLGVLPLLGIDVPATPDFPLPAGALPSEIPDRYVVLHPFARGAGKSMSVDAMRAFVNEFRLRCPIPVVVVGVGDVDSDLAVVNLAGRTSLLELIGILRKADLVVSVDSGPMHLAAALGVPLLGIHTWSDPRLVGPYAPNAAVWQGGEIRNMSQIESILPERPFDAGSAELVARYAAGIPAS